MLEQPASAGRAIDFLKSKSVDTVFLYADAFGGRNLIVSQPQLYRRLIRRLHASGLRAYALLGSGYLHTERYVLPKHRLEALAMQYKGVSKPVSQHVQDLYEHVAR